MPATRLGGELGSDQVRVRACGAGAGKFEHPRTECGDHTIVDRERRGRRIETVEVVRHRFDGLLVGPRFVHVVDERAMTDADATQIARPVLGGESRMLGCGLLRRVHPDVEDARCDGGRRRCAEQRGERAEQIASDVGDPQRGVSQRVQLRRRRCDRSWLAVTQHAAPDAGTRQTCAHAERVCQCHRRWGGSVSGSTREVAFGVVCEVALSVVDRSKDRRGCCGEVVPRLRRREDAVEPACADSLDES